MTEHEQLLPMDEVLACDFDGTITKIDACDQILDAFACGDWNKVGRKYERGDISHEEMNALFIKMLAASPEALETFIRNNIQIRNDFNDFILACKRFGIVPIIISGGWDFYIKILLNEHNPIFPESLDELKEIEGEGLPVICNHIKFDSCSHSWSIKFPFKGAQDSSPDKAAIINTLRIKGAKNIIIVGDGLSDRGMVEAADLVFSRGMLTDYCRKEELPAYEFETFKEIEDTLNNIRSRLVKVLSLPSYHPYNKRFDDRRNIVFVNPDSDCFKEEALCTTRYFEENYPPGSYDVVHIHFEYYLIPLATLEKLLKYFKKQKKTIIWTCHDRRSLVNDSTEADYEGLLCEYADSITTLTEGCAAWLESQHGVGKNKVEVIPHGYLAHPIAVRECIKETPKNRGLFTMLIGDFRKSKAVLQAIRDFLKCKDLPISTRLQLIYRPIATCTNSALTDEEVMQFEQLIKNLRIISICMEEIPDEIIIKSFSASHAVILPYLWGTHSGQVELARDCGCHVAVSDVGYYEEQWEEIRLWRSSQSWEDQSQNYQEALVDVYKRESLKPAGYDRLKEFETTILQPHLDLYNKLTNDRR